MNERLVALGVVFLFLWFVLTRNPKCGRGCKTIGQHLLQHGIDDILTGLVG